ncbi:MAG TPA: signal peptidase I [Catalimonadaceae bacterium]|nr:signal peptidase I [Catalimonadaceae bacterium]
MESNSANWSIPGEEKPKPKKSIVREWVDALIFALVVATLVRWFFFEPFTIPTPSMEKSLLVGDFLFVSKLHYGARTPKTILQVPLTHQKIWGTEIPSYLDWIQLPQFRLPGFSEVKAGDCVVFNWPGDTIYPTDLKTNYIKRCVAVAGDTLQVKNLQVMVNGKPAGNPEMLQYKYGVLTDQVINDRIFKDLDITEYGPVGGGYLLFTTPARAAKLKEYDFIKDVILDVAPAGVPNERVYAFDPATNWNEDNYGPILIPKEGMKLPMNADNIRKYFTTILRYEGHDKVETQNGKLLIDGKEVNEYTFNQNYYWMMGDNRHNSEDSRFWGFVPSDHVVGKAWMIWLSLEPDHKFFVDGIRWKRLFNIID